MPLFLLLLLLLLASAALAHCWWLMQTKYDQTNIFSTNFFFSFASYWLESARTITVVVVIVVIVIVFFFNNRISCIRYRMLLGIVQMNDESCATDKTSMVWQTGDWGRFDDYEAYNFIPVSISCEQRWFFVCEKVKVSHHGIDNWRSLFLLSSFSFIFLRWIYETIVRNVLLVLQRCGSVWERLMTAVSLEKSTKRVLFESVDFRTSLWNRPSVSCEREHPV